MIQENVLTWFLACRTTDVPENGGVCVKYQEEQIALFNFTRRKEWYATQNMCPHRMQMALSRGMIGTQNNEPKVACPFHKKNVFTHHRKMYERRRLRRSENISRKN